MMIFISFQIMLRDRMNRMLAIADERIYRIDGQLPAIDDIELFPSEILFDIFDKADDISLRRLSSISSRFEAIAQITFKHRYKCDYFVIDGHQVRAPEQKCSMLAFFKQFGSNIKAIEVRNFENMNSDPCITPILKEHTNGLTKLAFHNCSFENVTEILSQHIDLTDLTLQGGAFYHFLGERDAGAQFPNYRRLKLLKLSNFYDISIESLAQVISNNPQMECLDLCYYSAFPNNLMRIMQPIAQHLHQLKKLCIQDDFEFAAFMPSGRLIDEFANTVQNLESLGLTLCSEIAPLLRRLCKTCKQIKYLKLYGMYGSDSHLDHDMVEAIRPLESVEHLVLLLDLYDENIERLVESLPNLRHLLINMETPDTNEYILPLLRKCITLETIEVGHDTDRDAPIPAVNTQFFNEFCEITENRDAKLQFKEDGHSIGLITKDEVVWRNMRIYFTGFDPIHNRSNVNLLDLSDTQMMSNTDLRRSAFDLILEYLDLSSLHSLSNTCKRSQQLVQKYVEQLSHRDGQLLVTDEFTTDFDSLSVFAPFITNLQVKIIHFINCDRVHFMIDEWCKNLRKLSFCQCRYVLLDDFLFPQVRHLVLSGKDFENYLNFNKISAICPDLEIIEIKNYADMTDEDEEISLSFRCLKQFIFKPYDTSQLDQVKQLFENSQTEVIAR